ncbi:MAG: chromosomal replication initiator protein DnaA [Dehalococcoidia bacterium]|nr:chromosomal replication initiator protein DnaA [Dehalococcoidia bacterium]
MNDPAASRPETSAQNLWDIALAELQVQVTRPNYETWLKDTIGVLFNNGLFVVGAPNDFATEWLSTKLRPLIAKTLSSIIGHPVEVTFQLIGSPPDDARSSGPLFEPETAPPPPITLFPRPRLNERYTFERFIVGHENRLAHAASLAVADKPASVYNPLFIYGGTGLGKTHLLHAIGHRAWSNHYRVLYVTAEHFTNQFVTSIAQGRSEEFRAKYRHVDVLLIDDIQFLTGKERTQEEFFYTFNDLHAAGSQIIISSDRSPRLVSLLEDRLRSRFECGLIADIQPPALETRLAILKTKAADLQQEVPPDVLDFLAQRCHSNIRELEGCLNRTVAFARLLRAEITLDLATQALAPVSPSGEKPHPSSQAVLEAVSQYFDLPIQTLTGKSRAKEIAEARHIAMYLLREDAHLRVTEIARLLGGRDHSTVIYGLRKMDHALTTDTQFTRQLGEIRTLFAP